jgi:hypothetical protein
MKNIGDIQNIFNCPFTQKPLRQLDDDELKIVNQKILDSELYFFEGALCDRPLTKAYATDQMLYIYPVIDSVLFLKRETAIVAKNRIEYPHHRRDKSDDAKFYTNYFFLSSTDFSEPKTVSSLTKDELDSFKSKMPKDFKYLMTANATSADDIINLGYGGHMTVHFHLDTDLKRLKAVGSSLPDHIQLALLDLDHIPLQRDVVDIFINLEPIDHFSDLIQLDFYNQMKKLMGKRAVLLSSYHLIDRVRAVKKLKADILKLKAMRLFRPWSKSHMPRMYFIEIAQYRQLQFRQEGSNQGKLCRQAG